MTTSSLSELQCNQIHTIPALRSDAASFSQWPRRGQHRLRLYGEIPGVLLSAERCSDDTHGKFEPNKDERHRERNADGGPVPGSAHLPR